VRIPVRGSAVGLVRAYTLLGNATGLAFVRGNGRFIRWTVGNASPDVLTVEDVDAMVTSGADVASKFDEEDDAAVLDRLDELSP
jgi:hypothetical protein